jgi:hypothetical protein
VALNWIIPKARVRSFASRDVLGCLNWLHEIGQFDVPAVADAWRDAQKTLALASSA